MKIKNIIPIIALSYLWLTSCDEQKMEWHEDPTHGDVTTAELPLGVKEKASRYDALKTYTNLKLGVGIGRDLYMKSSAYDSLTNANFDEVTLGYAMKHGPMVQSNGEIKFDNVDAFIVKAKEAGLSVFGHTLVWHSNQNASYLNSLIPPTIIPAISGENSLELSSLKDASFTGWGKGNSGDGISIAEDEGLLSSGSQAVKLISSASSSDAWDLQLTTPEITVDTSHTYQISFFIKSDQAGKGRISFSGLSNNYPYHDWYNTGADATGAFETTTQWQQVKITVDDFTGKIGEPFKFNFDLGYLPSVTYYIDVAYIEVVDLDAGEKVINMLENGDFESGIGGWTKQNGVDTALVHVTGVNAYKGNGAMKIYNDADHTGSQWKTQIQSAFTNTLTSGDDYTVSFMIKSDAAGSIRCSTTGTSAQYQGDQTTSTSWTLIEWQITSNGTETGLSFDAGQIEGSYYIDNVVVTNGDLIENNSDPTIIEMPDEEKAQIIGDELENWISSMVTHYKNDVHAWDVVNEPMLESGDVRTGDVSNLADDVFYWVKYLGKDYAVTAFKLARQYGNAGDILFINDYNLESNLTKCQGLIDYVKYIEAGGATVDGIGTQMHISTNTDSVKIAEMFQMLAASGKLIKISELDISLGTNAPTAEQLAKQSEMYQYVIDMYHKYIPEVQRYGITLWGISDNANEHEYWLPDQSPNIWDAKYERKHAYMGVANGLAGKDISADFTGELVY